ncbi:class I SAM-dependent methyltransferase [Solwaraspora sp. WMMD406]|uniref:class I SAM-dependent methyltransferase n=1 Tax=Solwaraspora sp. WMMD406 TaxID=3016095 RepID=UPI0024180D18|nr:class I SAM-dependent methyltransferase [Solwaraspora sp. WMMD406]MDG4765893.1 class I SAM-dependent methyltransferase [Solwaraspora sp. WMMD406]
MAAALDPDRVSRWRGDWETMMHRYQPGRAEQLIAGLAAAEQVHGRTPDRVLDIGGGPGTTAEAILGRWPDAHVTVLDIDPALLALADTAVTQLHTIRADINSPGWISCADGPYDLVLALMTVHYLSQDRVRTWYAEARQLLRPGGVLLVGDVMPDATAPTRPSNGGDAPWTAWWTSLGREPAMASLLSERAVAMSGIACAEFVAPVDWHRATARQAGFGEATVLHRQADQTLMAFRPSPADPVPRQRSGLAPA